MQQLSNMRRFNFTDILGSTLLTYIAFLFFTSTSFPLTLSWAHGEWQLWLYRQPWLSVFGLLFLFLAAINVLWTDER